MNIITLEYVHKLLIENEKKLKSELNFAKIMKNKAEKNKDDNINEINALYNDIQERHCEASNVLQSFQFKQWN